MRSNVALAVADNGQQQQIFVNKVEIMTFNRYLVHAN
jgi:hypothetical protein